MNKANPVAMDAASYLGKQFFTCNPGTLGGSGKEFKVILGYIVSVRLT